MGRVRGFCTMVLRMREARPSWRLALTGASLVRTVGRLNPSITTQTAHLLQLTVQALVLNVYVL